MIIHKMKSGSKALEQINNGKKVIESRLYDEKRQGVNPGDQIEFISIIDESKKARVIVKALYRYPAFKNLFSDFSPFLFGGSSEEELNNNIGTFYSKEEERRYGVVGIKIELIK